MVRYKKYSFILIRWFNIQKELYCVGEGEMEIV